MTLRKKLTAWKKNGKLRGDIQETYEYQIDPKYVQNKLTELEDRTRRDLARIKETK